MPLTGELSDLSLAELIEFFCNQRKTGRLKVIYSSGPGYFYLQAGSVVHARIGSLRGIEAVYYALTLPNASFTFSPAFEPPDTRSSNLGLQWSSKASGEWTKVLSREILFSITMAGRKRKKATQSK